MQKEQTPEAQAPEQQEELTEEHLQKYNDICKQAADLAQDYQRQSQDLKTEMVGMVNIYNKNKGPEQAVPVEKIMQITSEYQEGMKEVQAEYGQLSMQLKKEEEERNQMMSQIESCFSKLEKMEKVMKEKNKKKAEEAAAKQESNGEANKE